MKAYFLPKSAGISPHCLVSHFRILVVYVFSRNHFSARSISLKSSFAFLLLDPTDSIHAVTVNGHIEAFLF